jgi:hypothetical protein
MSKARANLETKKQTDKLEYAVDLIEGATHSFKSATSIIQTALQVMDFGQITPKQMLDYLQATGR